MKRDFKSIALFIIVVVAVIVLGKMALNMYHGGKFEWKHKDGETKIKYERHGHDDYE